MRFQKAMIEALEKRLKSPVTDDKLPVALQELRDANAGKCVNDLWRLVVDLLCV